MKLFLINENMKSKTSLSSLQDVVLFVEVARNLSFSGAARRLGMPVATVSRRIAAFEKLAEVSLFSRTTRRVELTETGARHYERCARLVEDARIAQESLQDSNKSPKGLIRISAPVDFGVHVLTPWLADFATQYPEITFDLDLSSYRLDLPVQNVDIALRISEPVDSSLIAHKLGRLEIRLFASPAYLLTHGHPAHPTELAKHACITRRDRQRASEWRLEQGDDTFNVSVVGRFAINNQTVLRTLVERGLGIGAIPVLFLKKDEVLGSLYPVLADWSMPSLPIFAITASRFQPARVRLLLQFMSDRLKV